jgi:hypothetical protein
MKSLAGSSLASPHQPGVKRSHRFFGVAGLLAVATLVLFLGACAGPAQSTSATGANQASVVPVTSVTEQDELAGQTTGATSATSYLIKVYFSQFGPSDTNWGAVFPVNRYSPSLAVATYAIQSLIAGPTLSERASGYFSELNSALSGPSSCNGSHPIGGPDFTITLNKKGSITEQGTTTLQLCRAYTSGGNGTDARIKAEVTATLKQFSNITKVVILTQDGHCLGDETGGDQCLK